MRDLKALPERKYTDFVMGRTFSNPREWTTQFDDRFAIIPYRTAFIRRRHREPSRMQNSWIRATRFRAVDGCRLPRIWRGSKLPF